MAARNAPLPVFVAPHPRVTESALHGIALDFDDQVGAKSDEGGAGTEPPDAQLEGVMLADTHRPAAMGGEILGFGRKLAVGAGEQQIVRDEARESLDVGRQLCRAKLGFDGHDFGSVGADENGVKRRWVVGHAPRLAQGV